MPLPDPRSSTPQDRFQTTRWSAIFAARGNDSAARTALAELCAAYWYPIYAFARRSGHATHDAEDLTQGFFSHLLSRRTLDDLSREKGRFRSFLLAAMKNYVAHQRERAQAQKRGGNAEILSLDLAFAEQCYGNEPADLLSPDRLFDRRWAITVLERALTRVENEFAAGGKRALFDALRPALTKDDAAQGYAEIAARFETTEGALKVIVHRLRRRYRTALREEIAETMEPGGDVDSELRHLLDALN